MEATTTPEAAKPLEGLLEWTGAISDLLQFVVLVVVALTVLGVVWAAMRTGRRSRTVIEKVQRDGIAGDAETATTDPTPMVQLALAQNLRDLLKTLRAFASRSGKTDVLLDLRGATTTERGLDNLLEGLEVPTDAVGGLGFVARWLGRRRGHRLSVTLTTDVASGSRMVVAVVTDLDAALPARHVRFVHGGWRAPSAIVGASAMSRLGRPWDDPLVEPVQRLRAAGLLRCAAIPAREASRLPSTALTHEDRGQIARDAAVEEHAAQLLVSLREAAPQDRPDLTWSLAELATDPAAAHRLWSAPLTPSRWSALADLYDPEAGAGTIHLRALARASPDAASTRRRVRAETVRAVTTDLVAAKHPALASALFAAADAQGVVGRAPRPQGVTPIVAEGAGEQDAALIDKAAAWAAITLWSQEMRRTISNLAPRGRVAARTDDVNDVTARLLLALADGPLRDDRDMLLRDAARILDPDAPDASSRALTLAGAITRDRSVLSDTTKAKRRLRAALAHHDRADATLAHLRRLATVQGEAVEALAEAALTRMHANRLGCAPPGGDDGAPLVDALIEPGSPWEIRHERMWIPAQTLARHASLRDAAPNGAVAPPVATRMLVLACVLLGGYHEQVKAQPELATIPDEIWTRLEAFDWATAEREVRGASTRRTAWTRLTTVAERLHRPPTPQQKGART